MKPFSAGALAAAIVLSLGASENAPAASVPPPRVKIGATSQQVAPNKARVGATISVAVTRPAAPTPARPLAAPKPAPPKSSTPTPPPLPTLRADSPLLRRTEPLGPGTSWYEGFEGSDCIYAPGTSPICYDVVSPRGRPRPAAPPPPPPRTIATSLAAELDLGVGRIAASPAPGVNGLTGDPAWFWLAPAPSSQQLSVSLVGQHVVVVATPDHVTWRFGDGTVRTAGAGVAYREGPAPAAAVRHAYETRCLPGDRRRLQLLSAGCRDTGYEVEATIHWRVQYTASGRVRESGSVSPRSTTATLTYPVSEARAFLGVHP